ncbi:MAG: S46 family peptidase [Phycisphaerales bacterium]|nr:S46 family peptidase [Phycisphaerales bacterium]
MNSIFNKKSLRLFGGLLSGSLACVNPSFAKEGMKVPPTVVQSQRDIIAAGLEIPVETLYNTDGSGINNAVVIFGRGCTGEIISGQGLLLTNHHCGYGTVQGLATTQNDYFANGFWAMNNVQELPCPGLTVTFIRVMEDVTKRILTGLTDEMRDGERDSIISVRIKNLEKGFRFLYKKDAAIKSFANGNQYWAIISDTYKDIRLVGFPPNGIGAFGGDTDNWSWPRHTGDFSMFRVYADAKNNPAEYNPNNKPYQSKEFLTINTNGYKEGDFTLVYGFPGVTQEYVSSMQLEQVVNIIDPIRIEARTKRLNVWTDYMHQDRNVFLKYTSKRAGVANGWKKWQGEVMGLKRNNAVEKKIIAEHQFQDWANSSPDAPLYAKDLLAKIQVKSASRDAIIATNEYIREAVLGIEIIGLGAELDKILDVMDANLNPQISKDSIAKIVKNTASFYKNYDAKTDQSIFSALMPLFIEKAKNFVPAYYRSELARFGGSYQDWADYVYSNSIATKADNLTSLTRSQIINDPVWKLYDAISTLRNEKIIPALSSFNDSLARFNRLYMKSQMLKSKYQDLYPDANSTLRIAYGKVKGIDPEGSSGYAFQTNLDEAVTKHNPDVAEFTLPAKLLNLHKEKDYGRWAVNGTVPIAFIADNHTSGGNSGSPVLNAKGELIGTNFDRVWEGTMSDYNFDDRWCRNISLDVRYTLFIIDKLGGAGWLLKEMRFAPAASKK